MEKETIRRKFCVALGAVALCVVLWGAHDAHAAMLSLSPQSGTYFTGRSFSVSVEVSSPGEAINAVQGEVTFPKNDLEVLSVSKANSVLNLWVQDPTFSNQDGTVDFAGVVLSPGFQGAAGNVITITFEAKSAGVAPLSIDPASVLANDGSGTDILTATQGASFTMAPLSTVPGPPATGNVNMDMASSTVSPSTVITSSPLITNGAWYNINQVTFNWNVPAGADGINYMISTDPNLHLPDVNQGLVSQTSYDLSNFADGVWYFFVSFENGSVWSPPAVEKLMLDRTPPDSFVITREDTDLTDPQPVFSWLATDGMSGIDHYEAKIGDGDWFNPANFQSGNSLYALPVQSPTAGRWLTVRAFDKAGNYTDASISFRVLAPEASCAGAATLCALSEFFVQWSWLMVFMLIILLIVAYGFIYHLLRWKKRSSKVLKKFEDILSGDLGGPHLLAEQPELEKIVQPVVDDVREGGEGPKE
jgi:hypothetical protein